MTELYSYALGPDVPGLTNIESLGIFPPENDYSEAVSTRLLGSGKDRLEGAPITGWHWGFITDSMWVTLRTEFPGFSGTKVIRTLIANDNTYANFTVTYHFPIRIRRSAGRVLDFTIGFTDMVVIP